MRSDDANLVRLRFKLPVAGIPIWMLSRDVPVSGVTFHEALVNTTSFISGLDRFLVLERDPENQYHPNAIRVIDRWRGATGGENEMQIGWVPKNIAARITNQAKGLPIYGALKTFSDPKKEGIRESGSGFGCKGGPMYAWG